MPRIKSYDEGEIIKMFGLTRLAGNNATPIMAHWVNTSTTLNAGEQYLFDDIIENLLSQIVG
jgi:hypothetical protein